MSNQLFADILKAHDNLNKIEFKINGTEHIFFYKHLTILEHTRIKLACTKKNIEIKADGSKIEKIEENNHLYPIYCILEKALDKDGKKLFSLTNQEQFQTLCKLPFALLSQIAAEMSLDITGNINSLLGENNG